MGINISGKLPDGSRYMIVYGTVTRGARNTVTSQKAIPKSEFGLSYDRKQFMNVLSLGDSPVTQIASMMEKGDVVMVAGLWTEKEYTSKSGEQKKYSELRAEIVIPQPRLSLPGAAAGGDQAPDVFESAQDEDGFDVPF